jgi:hypothetical protein
MTDTLTKYERTDPLIPDSNNAEGIQPDRLFYATGVLLDAQDFQAEQLYHRSRLAQVLRYLCGSGTLAGLEVLWKRKIEPNQTDPDETNGEQYPNGREEEIRVQPGLAIDRLGRLIEVTRPYCIRLDRWFQENKAAFTDQPGPFVADVFIRFVVKERGRTPAFASGPFDALDAVTPSRLRDGYELHLVPRDQTAKLPLSPWSSLADLPATDRPAELHRLIFDAWQDSTTELKPLPEHTSDQNRTDLFLARIILPATSTDSVPNRTDGGIVVVENQHRSFIYPPAIAQLIA